MCRDREAVGAAIAARLDPQSAVCVDRQGRTCRYFEGCLKQQNRNEVADADVIVAPYDALFTGMAVENSDIALVVIDEGFWQRAVRRTDLVVESLGEVSVADQDAGALRNRTTAAMADRAAFGGRLRRALLAQGSGALTKTATLAEGLTAGTCRDMVQIEARGLDDPGLRPGLVGHARRLAVERSFRIDRIQHRMTLWRAVADLVEGQADTDGRVRAGPPDPGSGTHSVQVVQPARVHHAFRDLPVLHLDATLRSEIAGCLLPGLEVRTVEAAAPAMWLRLVTGRFGKGALLGRRSEARGLLLDCVDYVRWQVRRLAPGRVLVITHVACEAAFKDIPGVVTLHFNAVAGLDGYGDVAGIVVVGRPLPRDTDLEPFCAAFAHEAPEGGYRSERVGVRMRDGSSRSARALRHESKSAERFRAAICDDELLQDIGRGRGINRTADNPLEVHLLADVALPLIHDQVVAWETVAPDMFQRMLLAGVAVDSPSDACRLHPGLFANEKATQKLFEREGFKRHSSMSTYRGMSLKSARYRKGGRGRSWQTAMWLPGTEVPGPRECIEAVLGRLDAWEPV
ncbi:hypothetical protein ATO6_23475 [Oceanicola sp. 22II-s10i]|nr:hypothetical protein ATO6_23475 [Oceanicola sp. 22II-s10i]